MRGIILREKIYVTSTEGRSLNIIVCKIPHPNESGFGMTRKAALNNFMEILAGLSHEF